MLFQYTGIWYDVSRLPNIFLTGLRCDNATYTLNSDGTVTLLNQGVGLFGRPRNVGGVLTVINPAVPGAFRVVFTNCKRVFSFFYIRQKDDFSSCCGHLQRSRNRLYKLCICLFLQYCAYFRYQVWIWIYSLVSPLLIVSSRIFDESLSS